MKLNADCVRDILLAVEETTDYNEMFEYQEEDKVHARLKKYSNDEIIYHINQCDLAGLVVQCRIYGNGAYATIDDLSPAGHEFLANIHRDTIWQSTKEIAAQIGAASLGSLIQIAWNVVEQLIKHHFGFI